VNFFWAAYDPLRNQVYILSGDEDSLFDLDVVLYVVSLSTGQATTITLDNSKYTLSNLHVDPKTGNLYSVSPGLFGKNNWTIVMIDPKTGSVTLKSTIDYGAEWSFGYGGGVYNGISDDGSTLLHTFKWMNTEATALGVLDIGTGKVLYLTDIDLGINNENVLNSLVAI